MYVGSIVCNTSHPSAEDLIGVICETSMYPTTVGTLSAHGAQTVVEGTNHGVSRCNPFVSTHDTSQARILIGPFRTPSTSLPLDDFSIRGHLR